MKYPSIRIEGAILSADILDKIEQGELLGQKPKDFGFVSTNVRVKDEIVKAWADAQDMWRIYKRKIDDVSEQKTGTTETRNFWMVPFLGILGYDVELYRKAQELHGKTYAISHKSTNIDNFPIHIMGFRDSLDKKRLDSGPRMSPHALVQEYLNLNEYLYALVSNGLTIRLLRDSSRLIKLSFLEFDLEQMFEEEHFADFALMFRLIHCSRMPIKQTEGPESLIEGYHQDSLDSGSRIRDGLSNAVEQSIILFANGFLYHPENEKLRQSIIDGDLSAKDFYRYQLKFIYRLLFLMVIEERDLIFTKSTPRKKKDIYYNYYSVSRIRKLSEKRYLADKKYSDVWMSLKNTFKLFENEIYGAKLDVKPLAGDLFGSNAIGRLNECELDNKVMLECLTNLSVFTNPATHQKMRINYASLNVEEFGSVYEGLLEYDPVLEANGGKVNFRFKAGSDRSSSGSHYTPDELVQPLIKHSLDYIIEDKLKESNPEEGLLSITVCDVACGSGHFLLGAARRIATELAKIRTGEDQPSPSAFREAIRDVIHNCIYGVDLNPLAVELAKVALWLEAHNPGEPLHFLDHKIKCGDAIVGVAHLNELKNGIANEAFKKLPGDDNTARTLAKRNKDDKKQKQVGLDFDKQVVDKIEEVNIAFNNFDKLPENTSIEIEAKQDAYNSLNNSNDWLRLKTLSDIQTAQFFIPKTINHRDQLVTENIFRDMLAGTTSLKWSRAVAKANAVADKKRFFHWFLEFPEVFANGGFNCILGNPPFLGGQKISGSYGYDYLNHLTRYYSPAKSVDLVAFFFRRIFQLIKEYGFQALIATNTIAQGKSREGGLAVIQEYGGTINYAFRSMRWPGLANVVVAQVAVHKGEWEKEIILDNQIVERITSYLDYNEDLGDPFKLHLNKDKSFQGSIVLGKGFILGPDEAQRYIAKNQKNKDVLFPYLNGQNVNNNPDQSPSRWVINFFDWDEEKCRNEYPDVFSLALNMIKPQREKIINDKKANGDKLGVHDNRAVEEWWLYLWPRPVLYSTIASLNQVLVHARVTKTHAMAFEQSDLIFSDATVVFAFESFNVFAVLQSTINEHWAWNYSSTMKGDRRYAPSSCFETYPFPQNLTTETESELRQIGETYHEFRRQLMLKIQLGLTKTYNQFHNQQLSSEIDDSDISNRKELQKKFGKETINLWTYLLKTEDVCSLDETIAEIKQLRQLHIEMDEIVLKAYGWHEDTEKWGPAIDLAHDFYEVDYLPENDRIRYTIGPEARKEVLKRLLLLNHEIYEEEVKQGLHDKKKPKSKTKTNVNQVTNNNQVTMFDSGSSGPAKSTKLKSKSSATSFNKTLTKNSDYQIGQNVDHPLFGKGEIIAIEGFGPTAKITIKFENGHTKKLVAKYADLISEL